MSGLIIQCYVDTETVQLLERISIDSGGNGNPAEIETLAENAISEAALNFARERGWLNVR
jgi:hypothetical protein